ncbi:MAG: hypothetical protein ACRD45_22770 [Bryobacteraceae bacterium]
MSTPLPGNSSQTARLMAAPPGFAVGWQEPVYIPDPAAGANWKYTVDGRYSERLVSVRFTFTASAVVADRFPLVHLADANGRVVGGYFAGSNIAASVVQTVTLSPGNQVVSNYGPTEVFGFLPDLLVPPGWAWSSSVPGVDVGDQISAITLIVQRFPNDATSITAGE